MIYDCFMFNNELHLLEMRLNILKDVVDEFIIVELDRTHSGKKKPHFILEQNWEQFKHFPIWYVTLIVPEQLRNDSPHLTGRWDIENWHRRQLQVETNRLKPDDLVMISDIDEIPNPEVVGQRGRYVQKMYYFYLNAYAYEWTSGTACVYVSELGDVQRLRDAGHAGQCPLPKIPNGGWHFSSVGTVDQMLDKLDSFAHTELSSPEKKSDIVRYFCRGRDIHGDPLEIVDIDESYPKYIQDTWQEKWKHLVWTKENERIRALRHSDPVLKYGDGQ